jgi:GNAT superfamily N-acetyltransferase
MDAPRILTAHEDEMAIQPLRFWENWLTVHYMFRNYPTGLDVAWDAEVRGEFRRIFKRFLEVPFYLAFKNEGYKLQIGQHVGGLLYLQHPSLVTHINDIEVNEPYRGRGYSHKLLEFAENRARELNKKFMTLAVTLSNKRAFNIYLRHGYKEQHDRFYHLNRQWWSESQIAPLASTPITTKHYQNVAQQSRPVMTKLNHTVASANLWRFFKLETEITSPEISPVWLRHYPPQLPEQRHSASFGLALSVDEVNAKTYCGHADLFDYGNWTRWRLFLEPERWQKPQLKALLELLIAQVNQHHTLTVAFGSAVMHERAKSMARELGLQERYSERTLMIKILDTID